MTRGPCNSALGTRKMNELRRQRDAKIAEATKPSESLREHGWSFQLGLLFDVHVWYHCISTLLLPGEGEGKERSIHLPQRVGDNRFLAGNDAIVTLPGFDFDLHLQTTRIS